MHNTLYWACVCNHKREVNQGKKGIPQHLKRSLMLMLPSQTIVKIIIKKNHLVEARRIYYITDALTLYEQQLFNLQNARGKYHMCFAKAISNIIQTYIDFDTAVVTPDLMGTVFLCQMIKMRKVITNPMIKGDYTFHNISRDLDQIEHICESNEVLNIVAEMLLEKISRKNYVSPSASSWSWAEITSEQSDCLQKRNCCHIIDMFGKLIVNLPQTLINTKNI